MHSKNHRYGTIPLPFSLTTGQTKKLFGPHGSLLSVDIQNDHAADALQVLWGRNPYVLSMTTNDVVAINAAAVVAAATTRSKGYIRVGVKIDTAATGNNTIISFSDANTETALWLRSDSADKLTATLVIGGTVSWTLITDDAIVLDEFLIVKLLHNGVKPILHIDGATPTQTLSVSTSLTHWMSDLTGIDTGNIGALDYNSAGNADFLAGDIDFVEIFEGSTQDGVGLPTNMTLQLLFTEGTGNTIVDTSSEGDNGTNSGGTWANRSVGLKHPGDTGRLYHRDDDPDIKKGCYLYNPGSNTVTGNFKIAYEQ